MSPAVELARLCTALDLLAPAVVAPGVARLSDEVSLDWIRRYCGDRQARDSL
ncbi:hypothetical protein [Pelagovum pacificum]|uniref:hypothetical protein n=1 Tax=Pelagovum pacificum TaxID=2588711 RepID=UPI0018CF8A2C|nr:hypothetical protein [Pelagovum pacificum]QQA43374.1 hypothetical protein I8N54_02025 [Pelagovum pacificum]